MGPAKQAAKKPKAGTKNRPVAPRATISNTPANTATLLYPMPWMSSRKMFTPARGIKQAALITRYW